MTKGGERECNHLSTLTGLTRIVLSNRQDLLAAAQPATSVEHITFSPLGGWFIRFNDGTVQVSHSSGFSNTFHRLVLQYLDLSCQTRQYSPIRNVFFGAQEAVIVRTDRELLSAMLSQSLQTSLLALASGELKTAGFVLGRNTVLCPCNPDQYFLEAVSGTRSKHLYQMLATKLPDQLVVMAMEKQSPSDDVLNAFIHGPFSNRLSVSSSPQRPSSFSGLSPPPVDDRSNHRHTISYTASPDNTPWNGVPQVTYPQASTQEIPPAARQRYEAIFANEARGKPYLNGMEAAGVFMTSGLSRTDLAGIWDEADRDRNGQFDREEFVQAMWRIELQTGRVSPPLPPRLWNGQAPVLSQQYQPPAAPAYNYPPVASYQPIPPVQQPSYVQPNQPQGLQTIEILVAIRCKTCGKGLAPSDTVYRSATQHTIDYFCPTCHRPPTATQVILAAGKDLPQRKRSSMGCSGCWKDIKKGKIVWHCNKCWDKDLCQKCWGKTKKQCKHAASGQVAMMRVGKGGSGDEDDDELIADVIDGVVSIATGGL